MNPNMSPKSRDSQPQDEESLFAALLQRLHKDYCRKRIYIRYFSLLFLLVAAAGFVLTVININSLGAGKTVLLCLAYILGGIIIASIVWAVCGMRLANSTTNRLDALCSRFSTHRAAIFSDAHKLLRGRKYLKDFLRIIDERQAEIAEVLSDRTVIDLR